MARKKNFDAADDIRFQSTRVEDNVSVPASQGYTVLKAEDIIPSPFNEGLSSDDIDRYVESMKETGIIEPIVVYDLENGQYEILSGHQRYEAWCNVMGNKTIRAVVLPYEKDPVKRFRAHTEANTMTRNKDLRFWLSRIRYAKKVLEESGFKGTRREELQKISELLNGISKTQLYRYESFEKLIPELQEFESKGHMSANTLYLAVTLSADQQMEVAERVKFLQQAKAAGNPDQLDDMEVTREEFGQIVDNVRKGKASEKRVRTRSTYSERVSKACDGLIRTISRSRTQEERREALEHISKLKLQLEELEKELS